MTPELREKLLAGLKDGSIVPYLGAGVLADVTNVATGEPIPADSDSLIIAMNGGKPMAPKLMYEFARAAMADMLPAQRRPPAGPARRMAALAALV